MRVDWLDGLRSALSRAPRRRARPTQRRPLLARHAKFEVLEDRRLLAVDFGDAPDIGLGTSTGNYSTLSTDNGPQHTIVVGLRMGANVDGDGGALQNAQANADDVNGALPDDEDGLLNPGADLVLTIGAQPTLNFRVTNTTGMAATLHGWIDYNADGVFDNSTERASIAVPNGTNNGIVTLTLPTVPTGFTGTTYARFRLSTDAAAADPIGAAADGEVEDYRVAITAPSSGLVDSAKTKKIASGTSGGPTLANSDYFGRSVAAIGDIDGDGVTDLAVGANGDDTGGSARGAVHVLLMNDDGTVKSRQKITGNTIGNISNGDYLGSSVASVGDLDGDGVPDLAVGAERSDLNATAGSNRGSVFVLFLNANGTLKTVSYIYHGNGVTLADGAYFGRSTASIGDLDGDGVNDLVVGAYGDDTGGSNRGAVHVLFMNANGSVKSSNKIASGLGGGPTLVNSDKFGSSVTSLGDLDGDGVRDLAVGAIYDDAGGTNRGAVHVLFMNSNGTVKSSQKIGSGVGGGPTLVNGDQFGSSVAAVGDLDGDGVTDLAVGANYDDSGGTSRGAIHLLFMNTNGTVKASQQIASGTGGGPTLANDNRFGASIASMGDLDGDGRTDLAVGANFDDTGGINRGAVYTLFLGAQVTNTNPVITSPNTANVAENTTAVITVTATDADLPAQAVTFSLVGGADQARFTITSGGVLSFNAAPNFELPTDANSDNVYVVTVQASDGAGGLALQTISVTVTPVNDNSPVFTSPNTANVPENTTAVLTVTTTDADLPAQTVTLEITGGFDHDKFALNGAGELSFISPPDFETPTDENSDNVYRVAIIASDEGGFLGLQIISVTVTAVNETSPVFTSSDTANVSENTTAVLTVTATDADLPALPVTFSLFGGADQSKFSITSGGMLSFISAPNFEVPTDANGNNVYVVTVQANDGNGGTALQTINVTVTAINDNNPVFTSLTTANVVENTTAVLTVTATDADLPAQLVTFSIVGGADQSKFGITSGGILAFNSAPNFEMPTDSNSNNVYIVTVQASDGAGGTALQTLSVTVTPVNDNNPVFTSPSAANVPENTTAVLTVTATDADLPAQPVTFSLLGGADQSKFSITSGGILSFNSAPNFDSPTDANGDNVYIVSVLASDGVGGLALQTISVTVTMMPRDFGDAPDSSIGTGNGNYNTRLTDNGASHTIVVGLRMGADVDGDGGTLQNVAANADDVNGALPDDEDGLTNPAADLVLTIGAQPTVNVRVTNSTGTAATLYGWIDVNANGVFDIAERASVAVPNATNNSIVTLMFPTVPVGFVGTTYARFRLSTSVTAANPTGTAADGEVEDYQALITMPSNGRADNTKTKMIASDTSGGPTLANNDYFGRAVAAIGDIDGDGVTDLAVGANGDNTDGINRGAIFVLLMNDDGTVKTSQEISSSSGGGPVITSGDRLGRSVAALGDLNGDGVPDLAVGADLDDTNGSNRGAVHVMFLNTDGTVKSSRKIASGTNGGPTLANDSRFGTSVASPGDLDGDGVTDLAVGSSLDDTNGSDRGAVHVLFLNSDGTVKSSNKIASGIGGGPTLVNGNRFGSSLSSLGDLDGDGITDLAVGATGDNTGGTERGAVHVLLMNADGTVKSSNKIASGTNGGPTLSNDDRFGRSVAALSDLDGDGVADLAVGANYDDTGGSDRGAVHVLFLNSNGTVKQSHKIATGESGGPSVSDGSRFGTSLASLGDLDGDGVIDLAVGAETDDTGGSNRGAVFTLFLNVANRNPVITSLPTANVAENTTAVLTVTATDADLPPQVLTYSIVGGADQGKFAITSGGALSFSSAPNFEMPTDANGDNVYVVNVQASDGAGGTAMQSISVTVTAVNDNNPVFTSPDIVSAPENSTSVLTVTATDADLPTQILTYSIVGGADQAKFGITSGGILTFNSAPNFELPTDSNSDNTYVVIVQVSDGGRTSLQAILVTVTNVFDSPGDFDNDGDVDGRDFLLWQRGGSPMPLSSSDLTNWQQHYGDEEELSAVSGQLSAHERIDEALADLGTGVLVSRVRGVDREIISGRKFSSDEAVELSAVDRAFSELGLVHRSLNRDFGDIATRRASQRLGTLRLELESVF